VKKESKRRSPDPTKPQLAVNDLQMKKASNTQNNAVGSCTMETEWQSHSSLMTRARSPAMKKFTEGREGPVNRA